MLVCSRSMDPDPAAESQIALCVIDIGCTGLVRD